jgi:hypothetical protein
MQRGAQEVLNWGQWRLLGLVTLLRPGGAVTMMRERKGSHDTLRMWRRRRIRGRSRGRRDNTYHAYPGQGGMAGTVRFTWYS